MQSNIKHVGDETSQTTNILLPLNQTSVELVQHSLVGLERGVEGEWGGEGGGRGGGEGCNGDMPGPSGNVK